MHETNEIVWEPRAAVVLYLTGDKLCKPVGCLRNANKQMFILVHNHRNSGSLSLRESTCTKVGSALKDTITFKATVKCFLSNALLLEFVFRKVFRIAFRER